MSQPLSSIERLVLGSTAGITCVSVVFGAYEWLELSSPFIFGGSLVYVALLLILPWILQKSHIQHEYSFSKVYAFVCGCITVNLVLNGLGSIGWYRISDHYDDIVHIVTPFLGFLLAILWIYVRHGPAYTHAQMLRIALWIALFVVCMGVLWEVVEVLLDSVFLVHTSGQDGQPLDTLYDIIDDAVGAICGYVFILCYRTPFLNWFRSSTK